MTPIARYMVLCDDATADPTRSGCVNIDCLMSNITSLEDPPYPLVQKVICVFLVLTDCRGKGVGRVRIVAADGETERPVSQSPDYPFDFHGRSPLETLGCIIRMERCRFPNPGLYLLQFWYNSVKVDERPLRLR